MKTEEILSALTDSVNNLSNASIAQSNAMVKLIDAQVALAERLKKLEKKTNFIPGIN